MRHLRFFALLGLPILASFLFFPRVTLSQASPQTPPPSAPSASAPKADPKALETFHKVLDQLDPKKIGWLEMGLWEEMPCLPLRFQADGDYLSGPDHRLRLNLKTRLGSQEGTTSVVSDGVTMWTIAAVGAEPRTISKLGLREVDEVLKTSSKQLRQEIYQVQGFQGALPLFESLAPQMIFTKQETERWQTNDVLKLTAVWNAEVSKAQAPPPNPWPQLMPRECRILVDAKTYWPHRLELWGPTAPRGPDILLLAMEFRNPNILKPGDKEPERYSRAFSFDPGKENVHDSTKQQVERLSQIIAAMAQQSTPPNGSAAPSTTNSPRP